MKRFLLNLFLFFIFSTVGYIIFIVLFGLYAPATISKNLIYTLTVGYENTYSRLKEAEATKNIDILVLGSSHAYRGYDPRIFLQKNMVVFNLGTSSQTPIQTEYFVDKYLDQLSPKIVIIDIYPKLFGSDGAECMVDLLENTNIDKGLIGLTFKINDIKGYNSLIYCTYREVAGLNKNLVERKVVDSDYYVGGGYIETYLKYRPTIQHKEGYTIQVKQMDAFNRILAKLIKKNIRVVMVQSPMTKRGYLLQQNNEAMDSLFSGKGIYYNFNDITQLPDSLFYNDDHLNQKGVNVFNNKLIEILDKSGLITGNNK